MFTDRQGQRHGTGTAEAAAARVPECERLVAPQRSQLLSMGVALCRFERLELLAPRLEECVGRAV